jgi:hypothetical protein
MWPFERCWIRTLGGRLKWWGRRGGGEGIRIEQPKRGLLKARLLWALGVLMTNLGLPDAKEIRQIEGAWRNAQQRLHLKTEFDSRDDNGSVREAAMRVRAALLLGDGLAQNKLPWDQEVDFGRQQLQLAKEPGLGRDVDSLNLSSLLEQVRVTTDALATALNISPDKNRDAARSVQTRQAMDGCKAAFRAVLDDLDWHLNTQPPPDEVAKIQALRAPLIALHERYVEEKPKQKAQLEG